MLKRRNEMNKLRILLAKILINISEKCREYSHRLVITDMCDVKYEVPPAPLSFTTYKEGMSSTDYCTRHDAAAKLIGWYLYQNGHPLIEELVRAAEVLLEDMPATSRDVSFLVGAWKDQASATTDADREKAEETEHKIYSDLAFQAAKTIKLK